MSKLMLLILAASVFAGSGRAASLIGTNVTLNYFLSTLTTTDVLTVGSGTEVTCTGGGTGNANVCGILSAFDRQTIDIAALSITYAYSGAGSGFNNLQPNGFDFENLNPGAPITGVSLTTNIPGLDSGRVTFTANSIQVDMHNLSLPGPLDSFTVGISAASAIPEPSGLLLAICGLSAFAVPRSRSRT